ncbi:hypothetical protein [Pseudomonas sp. 3JA]|uniref:hypothetical protein n=1 Tax=Pseudomonas sp. 3JA TaxID=3109347 RepID=UPI00300965D6
MIRTTFHAYGFALLFGLTLFPVAMATSEPPATGAIIILRDKNDATCSLEIPAEGSGLTYRYELEAFGTKCKGFVARTIEFVELPSALKIFLSDDDWCSESSSDQDFWIKLRTTKKSTTVGITKITTLFDYNRNVIIGPGLLLENKYQKVDGEVLDKLSCIKIVASRAFNVPLPPAATERDRSWSGSHPEDDVNLTCYSNQIMTGRKHMGDEQGYTYHECATAVQSGASVVIQTITKSTGIKESAGIYFVCPNNRVMIGREHIGDENADTYYGCAPATNAGRNLTVTPHGWSDSMKEANSEFRCPTNQFLIGRWHQGDENGNTRYRCATLQ